MGPWRGGAPSAAEGAPGPSGRGERGGRGGRRRRGRGAGAGAAVACGALAAWGGVGAEARGLLWGGGKAAPAETGNFPPGISHTGKYRVDWPAWEAGWPCVAHAPSRAVLALQRARLRASGFTWPAEGLAARAVEGRHAFELLRTRQPGAAGAISGLVAQLTDDEDRDRDSGETPKEPRLSEGVTAAGAAAAFALAALHRSGIAEDLHLARDEKLSYKLLELSAKYGNFEAHMALAAAEKAQGECDLATERALAAALRLPPSEAGYAEFPPSLRERERHSGQYVTSAHVPDPASEELFLEDGQLFNGWDGRWGGGGLKVATEEGQSGPVSVDGVPAVELGSPEAEELVQDIMLSAARGEPEGLYEAGYLHLVGLEPPGSDPAEAQKYLREAAEVFEHAGAHTLLGVAYARGIGGLPQDFERALEHYQMAASKGDLDGMFGEAFMYQRSLGVEGHYDNPEMAYLLFKTVADRGHWAATYQMALMTLRGEGVEKNCTEAWRQVQSFVQQEGPWAPAHSEAIGMLDAGNGWGALTIFNELSVAVVAGGAANAGWVLRKGDADLGPTRGLGHPRAREGAAAQDFFLRSAKAGEQGLHPPEPAGWVDAGNMWYAADRHGLDAKPDMRRALEYYKKAADEGVAEGTYSLAYMHFWGLGTPQDSKVALALLQKSREVSVGSETVIADGILLAAQLAMLLHEHAGFLCIVGSIVAAVACHAALIRRPQGG